jgi:hypothetical protein
VGVSLLLLAFMAVVLNKALFIEHPSHGWVPTSISAHVPVNTAVESFGWYVLAALLLLALAMGAVTLATVMREGEARSQGAAPAERASRAGQRPAA